MEEQVGIKVGYLVVDSVDLEMPEGCPRRSFKQAY